MKINALMSVDTISRRKRLSKTKGSDKAEKGYILAIPL